MLIENIMNSARDVMVKDCELMKKNKEACGREELLSPTGKYYAAYHKLQMEGKEALFQVVVEEVCKNFPNSHSEADTILRYVLDENDGLAKKEISKAYFKLNDIELVDMLISDLRARFVVTATNWFLAN